MTKEEILQLEAGRELDALVMESVFGIKRNDGTEQYVIGHNLPHFSTDISAAWEVVEKMIELKMFINIGHGGILWRINVSSRKMYERLEYTGITAMTAPLAICRAALLVVGEEE